MLAGGQIGSDPVRPLRIEGGVLSGLGTIAGNLSNGGTITPGTADTPTGTINVWGDYTQSSGGALQIDFDANIANDLLHVTGAVQLDGHLMMNALPGTVPPTIGTLVVLSNGGTDAIGGAFANSVVTVGDEPFEIIYNGGDGNDVALQPLNHAPVASAGGPYEIDEGSGVALDASGSFDPDGGTLDYQWDLNEDGTYGDAVARTPF
jgi:hypothetical protein